MSDLIGTISWPVLDRIHFGSRLALSPHGLGIAVGFLLGAVWVLRDGPRRGVKEEHISSMLFWALVGTIVGARFFYVVAHFSEFNSVGDMFAIYKGGISLLGGIAGAVAFAYPVMRRHGYRFFQVMDNAAIGLAFGVFVGRIGDLIIGDHLGKPTSVPWAFAYDGGNLSGFDCTSFPGRCTESLLQGQHTLTITRANATLTGPGGIIDQGAGVHQTALYDFISVFFLFLFLYLVMNRKPRREGVMIMTFAIWYGSVRILTDFLRVDKRFFGLTGSQWTSVAVVTACVVTLVIWAIRPRPGPGSEAGPGGPGTDEGESTTSFVPPAEPSAEETP